MELKTRLPSLVKRFALIFFPVFSVFLLITYYIYNNEVETSLRIISEREKAHIYAYSYRLDETFKGIISDLHVLASDYALSHVLAGPDDKAGQHISALRVEFPEFIEQKKIYDQIRLLDRSGQEIIRADKRAGGAYLRPENELQNKADRYYFSKTMKLHAGEIYISSFDLNMEHGKIEHPLKPTIRFATPVFDHNGIKKGLLILNYLGSHLLNQIDDSFTPEHTILLNSKGFWLKALNPEEAWGFMYPEKQNLRFSNLHPESWAKMNADEAGQFISSDGMFTFTTIRPIKSLDDYWKLISFTPTEELDAPLGQLKKTTIGFAALLSLIYLILCIIIAYENERDGLKEEEIQEKDEAIREIVNSAFDGIITMDDQGMINSANPAACNMFGYQESELIGSNIAILADDKEQKYSGDFMKRYIRLMKHYFMGSPREVLVKRKDGTLFPMELCGSGKKLHGEWLFTGICRDITERKMMIEQLEQLATSDALTGLYNRGYFSTKLEEEFQRSKRYDQHLSLLIMDADDFKSVNDTYGHQAGDAFLKALAKVILGVARQVDIVARYGGEEFVVILPQTDGDDAMVVSERLRGSIENMVIEFEGQSISRTVSMGIASLKDTRSETADTLLTAADHALYKAKKSGKNRAEIATV